MSLMRGRWARDGAGWHLDGEPQATAPPSSLPLPTATLDELAAACLPRRSAAAALSFSAADTFQPPSTAALSALADACADAAKCALYTYHSGENSGGLEISHKTIPWTSGEDRLVCEGVELHGCKWSLISMSLPGRTDNAVRNRWHRLAQARRWREEAHAQAAQLGFADPGGSSANSGYKCRQCGQPKRGHVCPNEDTSRLSALQPLQPPLPPATHPSKRGCA
ncbi:hypothetical protein T492DRAFT_1136169 [Pavlovales sp. CCMP2436]|nr:hypothetical protein T492DRAFT_1136169 [Pavlovales sp. CCMP2436]